MANSLRAKIKKLNHDGFITDKDCEVLLKKLDGHDKIVKENLIVKFSNDLYDKSTSLKNIESDTYGLIHYEEVYEVADKLRKEF